MTGLIYLLKSTSSIQAINKTTKLFFIHCISVAPVFINANDPIQFGCYGQEMDVSVFVYNKYGTLQTTISKSSKPLNKKGIQKTILKQDIFHGVKVTVAVTNIKFQLTLDGIDGFTNYTVNACNKKGCNAFTVKVTSKCKLAICIR